MSRNQPKIYVTRPHKRLHSGYVLAVRAEAGKTIVDNDDLVTFSPIPQRANTMIDVVAVT